MSRKVGFLGFRALKAKKMFYLYSIIYTVGIVLMIPIMFFRRKNYGSSVSQRFGNIQALETNEGPVVWVHCVSVGETNAARPLLERILKDYPQHRLVISNTTVTGHQLARKLFSDRAARIFYFPFDWRFSVRRALRRINPKIILVFETEIWFNFFREAHKSGARLCIVNGRLSEKSVEKYAWIQKTMKRVLHYVDLALMQDNKAANRLIRLGMLSSKVRVTGNMKFDQIVDESPSENTENMRRRFNIKDDTPLIIAASTHAPEEEIVLAAFKRIWKNSPDELPRLLIAPRHPERFDVVEKIIKKTGFDWVKRSDAESGRDKAAEVILLDSIGELRDFYPLADVVFVGGSLIPHGGQSILEPAFNEKAIVTGFHTANFAVIVEDFIRNEALIRLPEIAQADISVQLSGVIGNLLADDAMRNKLAANAYLAANKNRGALSKTLAHLKPYLDSAGAGNTNG